MSAIGEGRHLRELYSSWNDALAARFYTAGQMTFARYLAIDDDVLDELVPGIDEDASGGAESFSAAVRATVTTGENPFNEHLSIRGNWRRMAMAVPPYLGLLGLCVLAASRMGEDVEEGVVPWDYYSQLNPLLGRARDARMPPGFDRLALLWDDLNNWIDSDLDGRLGHSTARATSHHTNIGWPLSQCLLREADRRRLADFFRSADLEPGLDIEQAQLWNLFTSWAREGCGLSSHGLRVVHNAPPQVADDVAELVFREFRAWDGELRDAQGRRRGEIVLALDIAAGGRRVESRFYPRRPERFPEGVWISQTGTKLVLTAIDDDWYEALLREPTSEQLERGFSLTQGEHALAYDPSLVVPLRASLELGTWVSVRQATLFEGHCVLVHNVMFGDVQRYLERHAEQGWRTLESRGNLPAGWRVIYGVVFSHPARVVPEGLTRLAPRLHTATRLEGGLQISPRVYLIRGEPDLWVTVEEAQTSEVSLDDQVYSLPDGALELHLSQLSPRLPAGDHEIVAGGVSRSFATTFGFDVSTTAGTGQLGHVLERHTHYRPCTLNAALLAAPDPARGTVYVCGASARALPEDLPRPIAAPVLIRRGFQAYAIVGADPQELLSLLPPSDPKWIARLGLAEQFFDQPVPFAPQWVVLEGNLGVQVHPLAEHPASPVAAQTQSPTGQAWAEAIAKAYEAGATPSDHRERWEEYVALALRMLAT